MIMFSFGSHLPLFYLWVRMDPVGAISVMSDYLLQQVAVYWVSRGISAGAVSVSSRLLTPVKDVGVVHDYVFQSRSVDELIGRVGDVCIDAIAVAGTYVSCGTFPGLKEVPNAGPALIGRQVNNEIAKYHAALVAQAAAGELLHKRVATLSVFEKLIQSTSSYMQQSIPAINIMHFLNVQTNIAITSIAVGLKMAVTPFLRRRNKMEAARNSLRRVFNEDVQDVIDVDFFEIK